jgi:hypothetical protein
MSTLTRSFKHYLTTLFSLVLLLAFVPLVGPQSEAAAQVPDWSIRAQTPNEIWSNGGSWAVGTDILVLVNDGTTGPEFGDTVQVEQWGENPEDVGWYVDTGSFEIEPGDLITVSDDQGSKDLTVSALTVDTIDMEGNVVSGTAPADSSLEVYVSDDAIDVGIDVTADGSGVWQADFNGSFDIRPGTWGSAAVLDTDGDATERSWHIQVPEVNVSPASDAVDGYWFELGATVTVEIDDPANGAGVDWSASGVAVESEWDPSQSYVGFLPGDDGFDVAAGQLVTMSDGVTTKDLVVSTLAFTDIDATLDLVHGVATADATVWIWPADREDPGREIAVGGDGTWTADYSAAQGDSAAYDFGPGDGFDVNEYDDDGDTTHAHSRVANPQFSVETPNQVWSNGEDWVVGRTVTITVNDGAADVYTTTAVVEQWGPEPWEVGWYVDTGGFEIVPGHVVTVDDGVDVVRTLEVVDVQVTQVDEDNETVSGTVPPNARVNADAGNEFEGVNRQVQADAAGNFLIEFGTPGDQDWEQDIIDLQPGVGGSVQVPDADGDSTSRSWAVAAPYFGVDVVHRELWAYDWPVGATLSFQVFEPDDLDNPVWDDTMTVVDTTWGQTEAGYRFWDDDFVLHAGQVFTVTDGTITHDLIVSTLEVTNVDPDTDTYTGTVDPDVEYDSTHEVCAWARDLSDPQQGVELCTMPDENGDWTIDFTGVGEIFPGEHTGAYQTDPDGDQTSYSWHVPPWLYVEIGDDANPDFPDRIHLDQWDFPVDITDGVDTVTVFDTDGDGWEVVDFDVSPFDTLTATGNDGRVKSLYVENLAVTDVTAWDEDPPSTAFGTTTASDNGQVQVTASADYGWWTERWVDISGGAYEADFANPGNGWREQELGYFGQGGADDVYSGGEIRAHVWDADNDQVQAVWHATNPRIIIVRGNDRIEAIDFPKGEPLTVELDDPEFAGIEFSETGIPAANPDKPWETLLVFELGGYTVPDQATVTALDGSGTPVVQTEVIAFTIDDVDQDADRITGTAPEGAEVLVEADGNWRYPVADATGTWIADFSQPGTQPGEENPVDLAPGSSGGATLIAEGGSATTVLWSVSNARFWVDPQNDQVWGDGFTPGTAVTITVDGTDHGPFSTYDGGGFDVSFDPAEVDIVEGMTLVVADSVVEKTHVVTALTVTGVDEDLEQVAGLAEVGSVVDAWVNDTGVWRQVTADDGTWVADFAADLDLRPGSNGGAEQCDVDGDCTHVDWQLDNPSFGVDPHHDGLWGDQWAPDDQVTIWINDIEHSTLPTDEWGTFGNDWDPMGVDIVAGDDVDVTQGDVTKTHHVTSLEITSIDVDTDIMTGVADGPFDIWVHDTDAQRHVDHDGVGEWTVDWSVPGPNDGEETTVDLEPGSNGNSSECDDDGDCTYADWYVTNPMFRVDPVNGGLWGHEWYDVTEVTVTTDTGFDEVVAVDGNGDWWTGTDPAELVAGTTVTVTGGDTAKTLVVSDLAVESVAAGEDAVVGTAEAGTEVRVEIHEIDDEVWRLEVADGAGDWTADFTDFVSDATGQGAITFEPGVHGAAHQDDDDGDATWIDWNVANPSFSVETPSWVSSQGDGWMEGRTVTLVVDDDDDTNGVLFTDTTAIEQWGPEPWEVGWSFQLDGTFEIQPGNFVTVDDGVDVAKALWVEDLAIIDIDEAADTISGTAGPLMRIDVSAGNDDYEVYRSVESDASGSWTADFSVPGDEDHEQDTFDIQTYTGGAAQIYDDDGDATHAGWFVEPVENAPPEILSFDGPEEPLSYKLEAWADATFVDPEGDEGLFVSLEWGDGNVTSPEPVFTEGTGAISDTHFYGEPGIYTLTITVTDSLGASTTETFDYAVMYDPAGRKILASVQVVDEVPLMHLGVNVTPQKKTGVPKGHVRFNPVGAGFGDGFDSTGIDYLLIFGDWGIVTGTSTIDGEGAYQFLVSALDQDEKGGIDAFRVLIWNEDGVVYDTQPGDDAAAMPTTEPTDGDIKVR